MMTIHLLTCASEEISQSFFGISPLSTTHRSMEYSVEAHFYPRWSMSTSRVRWALGVGAAGRRVGSGGWIGDRKASCSWLVKPRDTPLTLWRAFLLFGIAICHLPFAIWKLEKRKGFPGGARVATAQLINRPPQSSVARRRIPGSSLDEPDCGSPMT